MKTEELTNLGLTKEQADAVFALAGKDIEKYKKQVADLTAEKDGLSARLITAEDTLKGFEGIDPAAIHDEIAKWKQAAEDAEKSYAQKILQRDQRDWIGAKLNEYGVTSPFARRQLTSDVMAADSGLTWKDGSFFGFDDFMKKAKEQDSGLYQTAEEKAAAEAAAAAQKKAPSFVGPTGGDGGGEPKKYVPPKIF